MTGNAVYVWIDCEMTGLGEKDCLLEIATIVTDANLEIIAEGPDLVISRPKTVIENMNEW